MNDSNCVVRISGTNPAGAAVSGTGFLIDDQGRVATCLHVVAGLAAVNVQLALFVHPWRYRVVRKAPGDDLAILDPEVKPSRPTPHAALHPDWKKDVAIGDPVAVWGYSAWTNYETAPQLLSCAVSGFSEQAGLAGLNGSINPGDSGGPVFDRQHRVIGIVMAKDAAREGQAMFIPVSLLRGLAIGLIDDAVLDARGSRLAGDVPAVDRGYDIVGRDALFETVKQDLIAGHDQALVVLPGVGKTTVAAELAVDPEIASHFAAGILWANLGKNSNVEAQLRGWIGALGIAIDALKDSRDPIDALKAEVRRSIGSQRMLVVLDDVWDVGTARKFMELGRECVFLSTTRSREVASDLIGADRVPTPVKPLTADQGLQLLRQIAKDAVARDPAAAARLVDCVAGLPLALVLVGKYLRNAYADGDEAMLRHAYERMQQAGPRLDLKVEGALRLSHIINVSYEALADDGLRRAFRALSIFRPDPHAFTAEMAEAICGVDLDAFQALRNMGLIEFRKAVDADQEDGYTMHRLVAEFGRNVEPDKNAKEIPLLHAEAVRYYAERMADDIEHEQGAYLSKYRFEDRGWQRLKEAWLYHLAQTGDTVVAMRAFLRVWFDAFFWWGYYQRFPFCERLVREWRSRDIDPRARVGLDHVSRLEASYPAGYEKRVGGDWKQVQAALEAIRTGVQLDGPVDALRDGDARIVSAFTHFLLAEAWGYGRNDRDRAMTHYRAAHDLFTTSDGAWEARWLLFYIGQFWRDMRDSEEARTWCMRSLDEALAVELPADVDPELLANDYRLLAEVETDPDAALAAARHASFYAYAFQAYPEDADTYTMAFYREITGRIVDSLIEAAREDTAAATARAAALRAFWADVHPGVDADWASLLATGDAEAVIAAIFPPDVADADLATDKSARADAVAAAIGRLQAALPDTRLPPRSSR